MLSSVANVRKEENPDKSQRKSKEALKKKTGSLCSEKPVTTKVVEWRWKLGGGESLAALLPFPQPPVGHQLNLARLKHEFILKNKVFDDLFKP